MEFRQAQKGLQTEPLQRDFCETGSLLRIFWLKTLKQDMIRVDVANI